MKNTQQYQCGERFILKATRKVAFNHRVNALEGLVQYHCGMSKQMRRPLSRPLNIYFWKLIMVFHIEIDMFYKYLMHLHATLVQIAC